jgi:hypothetical protein
MISPTASHGSAAPLSSIKQMSAPFGDIAHGILDFRERALRVEIHFSQGASFGRAEADDHSIGGKMALVFLDFFWRHQIRSQLNDPQMGKNSSPVRVAAN